MVTRFQKLILHLAKQLSCVSCLVCLVVTLQAQTSITELDSDTRRLYDRMSVLSGSQFSQIHSALLPLRRVDAVTLADSFLNKNYGDKRAEFLANQIYDLNNEFVKQPLISSYHDPRYHVSKRPLFKTFYKTPAHFFEVDVPDFYLRVNPVLYMGAGRELSSDQSVFINSRGISLRGGIGKSVYFQSILYDTQAGFSNYVERYISDYGILPGAALYKRYTSKLWDRTDARDYLLATGYVGVNLGKYFDVQLGHNQHFIGDGVRSLLLSDFSTPYFSLRINTRIWKLHYQNIFAELAADDFHDVNGVSQVIPKKFMAAHYLSYKISPAISVGVFESVIFDRPGHQFELQYLNPVIFYRSIEGAIGSPDNVLLGINGRVDLWKTAKVYGQVMLDDLQIRKILGGNSDNWGNKTCFQLGGAYYNAFGIKWLDLQAEWNRARPYTYSHYDATGSYSHYNQPLAHPLGANFNEFLGTCSYQISPRLLSQAKVFIIRKGEDNDSVSYGGNILVPNTQRPGDDGHSIGQGFNSDILIASLRFQYQVLSGIYLELEWIGRKQNSVLDNRNLTTNQFFLSVRYHLGKREDYY